jgi:ribonucleoside-triphosphate reductase (thioredoxin)
MELASEILSNITVHMKYAKYQTELGRRETWDELVTRNMEMHKKKYPQLVDEIHDAYEFVYDKKVLPSMRSLQFGGKSIEISPNRVFNCAYLPIDDWRAFSETMFLLLGGTGVGYSVQYHHVDKLPEIRKPNINRKRRFLIGDSIEGWADAIKVLMKSYSQGLSTPIFDFSDIRAKGSALITSGGKAPGPQPLKDCIHNITKILDAKNDGEKLSTLETHDIICFIADAVLAGGIRRAALISLFSFDDESMATCKYGNWWELNPQRGRANNSTVILRHRVKKAEFLEFWERVKKSGAGEPGVYFSHDKDMGTNPCAEIALLPNQFCNLTEINTSTVVDQDDLNERARVASFIGTLQAGYTDFHYLRDVWRKTTEKEALIGVGMTGIASGAVLDLDLADASKVVLRENARVAKLIGINRASRTTTVKPSGTSSLVLGCSSGIHAWHSEFYIRNIRVGKNESIYGYLKQHHPELVEDEYFKPQEQAVIGIPQKAHKGAILRSESTLDFLERVAKWNAEWVRGGHRTGANTHNVSATISIKNGDWNMVADWMWVNRGKFNGLSCLPHNDSDHTYVQAPFQECTEAEYDDRFRSLKNVDLTNLLELEDNTTLSGELACVAGGCEV